MTEQKKSPNPFINMANEAKKNNGTKVPKHVNKMPKQSKGFGAPAVVRRSGRGG